jgi:beta-phosphoglucomutase-like phosphatase (HAD superfamily)
VPITAVVFDFDGVIIDSEVTNFDAWSETYRQYGCELVVAEYLEAMGGHHFNLYELLTTKAAVALPDEDSVRAAKRARHLELVGVTGALPGVAEWMADARALGFGVGIASSADEEWLDHHLARLGLEDSFDCVCAWDGEIAPKPAPALYLRACERLGVEPSNALAVEDSPNGLLAARRAGLHTVAVTHRLTLDIELAADLVTGSLLDLRLEDALAQLPTRASSPET